MDEKLTFWRERYKKSPPAFQPIIATLGKLIKFGESATAKDITPAELQALCSFTKINLNIPDVVNLQNCRWNIPPQIVSAFSDRISKNYNRLLTDYVANFFDCKPVNPAPSSFADFDYNAEFNNWIDFLRKVYRRVEGTKFEKTVKLYGKIETLGDNLQFSFNALKSIADFCGCSLNCSDSNHDENWHSTINRELKHCFLVAIVERVIKKHADLYQHFIENFIFTLHVDSVEDFPDVEFWQAFDDFVGSCLYYNEETRILFYFKLDACNFFKIAAEELN